MSTTDTIPPNPEAAALDRIVRLPVGIKSTRETRQRCCSALQIEGVFAGLSWPDAQMVADAVSFDIGDDGGVKRLRSRARKVLGGWEDWDDRASAVRALNLAPTVLEDWEGVR
jgi:hypothetical protein